MCNIIAQQSTTLAIANAAKNSFSGFDKSPESCFTHFKQKKHLSFQENTARAEILKQHSKIVTISKFILRTFKIVNLF